MISQVKPKGMFFGKPASAHLVKAAGKPLRIVP
jgi:hypothetical protein